MKRIQLDANELEAVETILTRLAEAYLEKRGGLLNCLSCAYFAEDSETCNLSKPAARPPARILCKGCPKWQPGKPF